MDNFTFYNPVKIVFGKNTIPQLENLMPKTSKVMLLYGGGSIKNNGVYDKVAAALKNHDLIEFGGIEPNPLYETCMKAVAEIKKEKVDFLLAVGGGSVLDATKFIAAAAEYKGDDPWEILLSFGEKVESSMSLGAVLTLPATGSEMNPNSVISRKATSEKLFFGHPSVYPEFSILDPETTYSLPERQVANGIVDAFVHVMEQYMTYPVGASLQDRFAEGIIQTLVEEAPKVRNNPKDYDSRANIMWSATLALNGLIACGVPEDWSTHMIGHELTAFYGIDHAQSLAVVLPALWRNRKDEKNAKLLQFGQRVWSLNGENKDACVDDAIAKTAEFFESVGVKTKLADYGIDKQEAAEKIRDRFKQRGSVFGEHGNISPNVVYNIIMDCQ